MGHNINKCLSKSFFKMIEIYGSGSPDYQGIDFTARLERDSVFKLDYFGNIAWNGFLPTP